MSPRELGREEISDKQVAEIRQLIAPIRSRTGDSSQRNGLKVKSLKSDISVWCLGFADRFDGNPGDMRS